ncbi:SDR family oxidoreductase [Haloferula sp.]|uniref:SDR family oxidoreductase n=1 Tax=Haloferula sp. TaxID=2497595 RepID=UPI003C78D829
MRLAITGTQGRVGRALADRLGKTFEVHELDRGNFDLSAPDLGKRLSRLDFDLLLHPAAMTSLEACEDDPELARRINAEAPGELAKVCRLSGRGMVHFSTDYVLAGDVPGLHDEDFRVEPISVYGESKLGGERRVLDEGGCVMRVSWVFGPERPAFPDQVITRALAGEPLMAVADKTSLPTFTRDLAEWVGAGLETGFPNDVLHACNGGEPVSWHGMALEVVECLLEEGRLKVRPVVETQKLDEISAFRAARPRHTAMATGKLSDLIGSQPRNWREALREYVFECLISR